MSDDDAKEAQRRQSEWVMRNHFERFPDAEREARIAAMREVLALDRKPLRVVCDETNNPPESVAAGFLIIDFVREPTDG